MSLNIGIVGLPNVGKSTLFQLLTKKEIGRSNYPFCTIDPNVGVVTVPDERVDKLAELTHSQKKVYTAIQFVDIAGLVKGASQGEGLGNQFLAHIREVDAVLYVLRGFKNEKVINIESSVDILRDKETLDTEMALKDLATLDKRLNDLPKDVKGNKPGAKEELALLQKIKTKLDAGQIIVVTDLTDKEREVLKSYQLLTLKPRLYLLNGQSAEIPPAVIDVFTKNNWPYLIMDVLTEFDQAGLSPQEKQELGISEEESRVDNLIQATYQLLDLITFLTTGPDETRAWTLKRGATAPQAGGVIHTDFEQRFIKAEVISYDKLITSGGLVPAREKGLIRTEGKNYIVQDGDVIEIKSDA